MADGDGPGVAAAAAASPQAPAPGPSPPPGWRERLRAGLMGTWASLWFVVGLGLLYALRVPLRLCENVAAVTVFLNSLTSKFYVALTGTCSLISGLIFIFEWWYFHKHGTSFIEQVSVNHLRPLMGGTERSMSEPASLSNSRESENSRQNVSECKVWRNPLNLFRGAEYRRLTWVTGKEPLTYYDMNLSAQDHQTFFTCDTDFLRPSDTGSKLKVTFSRKSSLGSSFFSAVLQCLVQTSMKQFSTTNNYFLMFLCCFNVCPP
uniref:Suppressor of tumorigenicity 7 protein-like n=1 Tax=Myotis myotis TaxID=51298 RepID=A0A7J7SUA1_MYOMY|nr:suppression of tumorigenicity 7 like [Myotis myotis]